MFKVSQDIQLNSNHSNQSSKNDALSFSSPELTDIHKVQILNFPQHEVKLNSDINFIIKKNNVQGNFEVQLETPIGNKNILPLQIIDLDQFGVHIHTIHEGLHKIHIKCNSITLPISPLTFMVQLNETKLPIFKSDVTKVKWHGPGLQKIILKSKNEFTIDASNAGNNILFVGICGPNGQCDEVSIKHCGNHIYQVCYQVKDPGMYMIIAKWGENHIPGSPFNLGAA